jgi:hypothetical protein
MSTFARKLFEFLWAQIIVGLLIAAAILVEQIRFGIIQRNAIHSNMIALVAPYGYVLMALVLWHLFRAFYSIYFEQQSEMFILQAALDGTQKELLASRTVVNLPKLRITIKEVFVIPSATSDIFVNVSIHNDSSVDTLVDKSVVSG